MDLKKEIIQILKRGRDGAQTKAAIGKALEVSPRLVEYAIRDLIVGDGYLIGSACDKAPFGYFVLEDADEMKRYRGQLVGRMRKLNERLSVVDAGLARNIRQQLSLL